jgi:hypothetical protein
MVRLHEAAKVMERIARREPPKAAKRLAQITPKSLQTYAFFSTIRAII